MRRIFAFVFGKVHFTCGHCGARQRIPLRRIHAFERFQGLEHGEAVLIACPGCRHGLQMPTPYHTHNGITIDVDPQRPPENAFVHDFY
jgi:hypothetical protein